MKFLLQNVSANATGTAVENSGEEAILAIFATSFGGGTVTVEGTPNGGTTWITLTKKDGNPATFTANAFAVCFKIAQGYQIRARLTGSTNPVALNVTLGI